MKLHSEDRRSSLELAPCKAELHVYPSIAFSVSLATPEVTGRRARVRFSVDELEQFISALRTLDGTRRVAATLRSMSPDEFSLDFIGLDSTGYLGVRLSVASQVHGRAVCSYSFSAGFEIDSTALSHIVDALRADLDSLRAENA